MKEQGHSVWKIAASNSSCAREQAEENKRTKRGRTKQVKRTKEQKEQANTKKEGTKAQRTENSSEQLQLRKRTEYQAKGKKEILISSIRWK